MQGNDVNALEKRLQSHRTYDEDCTCAFPKCRKTAREDEIDRTSEIDDNEQEINLSEPSEQSSAQREAPRVNVYFTNRWVSSLANRIQNYVRRRSTDDQERTPTVVVTDIVDTEDDALPCYNNALSLAIHSMKSLDSPPSYEEIFVKFQQTKL
ncbi:unnamed protein product [Mytilus edulis]|uniref:Uncharacterized protein n=1 Tax=Mytilus edulis TaxID=6550 RepID=A0A8S3TPQ4_MYTED|nr:unnamed protein product [Mytilus edulis]